RHQPHLVLVRGKARVDWRQGGQGADHLRLAARGVEDLAGDLDRDVLATGGERVLLADRGAGVVEEGGVHVYLAGTVVPVPGDHGVAGPACVAVESDHGQLD